MRKLKRSIARANMIDFGMEKLNKPHMFKNPDGTVEKQSLFARNWRKFVKPTPKVQKKINAVRKKRFERALAGCR